MGVKEDLEDRSWTTVPSGVWTAIPDTNLEVLQENGYNCTVSVRQGFITLDRGASWIIREKAE